MGEGFENLETEKAPVIDQSPKPDVQPAVTPPGEKVINFPANLAPDTQPQRSPDTTPQPILRPDFSPPESKTQPSTPEVQKLTSEQEHRQKIEDGLAKLIHDQANGVLNQQADEFMNKPADEIMAVIGSVRPEQQKAKFIELQTKAWVKEILDGKKELEDFIPGLLNRSERVKLIRDEQGNVIWEDGIIKTEVVLKEDELFQKFLQKTNLLAYQSADQLSPEHRSEFEQFLKETLSAEGKKETFRQKLYQAGIISLAEYVTGSIDDSNLGDFLDFIISNHHYAGGHGGYEFSGHAESLGNQASVPEFYEWLDVDHKQPAGKKMEAMSKFVHGLWSYLDEHVEFKLKISPLESVSDPPTVEEFQNMMAQLQSFIESIRKEKPDNWVAFLNTDILKKADEEKHILNNHLSGQEKKYVGSDILLHIRSLAGSKQSITKFFEISEPKTEPEAASAPQSSTVAV